MQCAHINYQPVDCIGECPDHGNCQDQLNNGLHQQITLGLAQGMGGKFCFYQAEHVSDRNLFFSVLGQMMTCTALFFGFYRYGDIHKIVGLPSFLFSIN